MSEPAKTMRHWERPWKCWCGAKGGLGNRPEDAAAEAFYDELDDKCMEFNCPYLDERLVAWLWEKVSSGAH